MTIKELVVKVQKKFNNGEFDKFIHRMCFPKFKSFSPGAVIDFNFPITVLVGPNGGGKSSVLHAAWGMPLKHSTSRFWFSTPVDPIEFSEVDQNRYWYTHYIKDLKIAVQSRKMSGNKRHGYWEPTRPAQKEGMEPMPSRSDASELYMSPSGDRWTPVDRTPLYFNAKAEYSAFDRFFNSHTAGTLEDRQDYFIKYSSKLKDVINRNLSSLPYYGVERVERNFLLSETQLASVNMILQKKYKSARYVSHKFYDRHTFSPSVIFETDARSYSECFAGSGELAVVNYVLALENLTPYDLLLLDEPETSLHPGAQEKLIEHLLKIVCEKHIQVIISTHSQTFVELLPLSALVVLEQTADGIAPRANPTKASAFARIGVIEKDKIVILTEDNLLKAVVDRALSKVDWSLRRKTIVVAAEVGVSEMLSNQVRAHIQTGAKVLMVLDGDQRKVADIYNLDPADLSLNKREQIINALAELNIAIIGSHQDVEGWMRWCQKHVLLLDQVCPEQILLGIIDPQHKYLSNQATTNGKFKDAVKDTLHRSGNDNSSAAQYNILKFKLGELADDDPISQSILALAKKLQSGLTMFEESQTC